MHEEFSVLFVDDEVSILRSIERSLFDEEYTSYFASSGKKALEIMESKKIDVIVTDMRMPEMNGLELLNIITEKWPNTVKIVLSGYAQLGQILATINQVDIFKFLTKPWSFEELETSIYKALEYCRVQQENIQYKKALEIKNQAYQNILKKVNEVVNEAKRSTQIIGRCGIAILKFGKEFDIEQKHMYKDIFDMEDKLFEILVKHISVEKKEVSTKELANVLYDFIINKIPSAKIEKKEMQEFSFFVNLGLLKAMIEIIFTLFYKQFKKTGVFLNIGVDQENKFIISILFPMAFVNSEKDEKNNLTFLDIKLQLIKDIFQEALHDGNIKFQPIKLDDNLLFAIGISK
ncbi:response regulator [Anaerotignum sp.]|uniref:response regulator n=1 Tax=Anaerotignum sp. TaxID=2039241 RepID=UPI002714DE6E|nr:response regulator [Anaerotignum sp.]